MTHVCRMTWKAAVWRAAAAFLLVVGLAALARGSELDERRIRISLEIFPRIVAVDQDLRNKLSETSKVRLTVIYDHEEVSARRVVGALTASVTNIGDREVEVASQSVDSIIHRGLSRSSALYLAEQLDDAVLAKLVQLATASRVLVFSPFAGDVERGATVGIAISSRIRPYFNVPVLNRSKISINEKLLSISQRYE